MPGSGWGLDSSSELWVAWGSLPEAGRGSHWHCSVLCSRTTYNITNAKTVSLQFTYNWSCCEGYHGPHQQWCKSCLADDISFASVVLMLGDISGLEKIYIVCHCPVPSFFSVEEDGKGLKPCFGNLTASLRSISGCLSAGLSMGQEGVKHGIHKLQISQPKNGSSCARKYS